MRHRAQTGRAREVLERQALVLLVLVGVTTGIALVVADRAGEVRGAFVIGGSLVLAGLARTVVSERRAGFLVNRGRLTDALTLTALGLAIIVIAASLRQTYATI